MDVSRFDIRYNLNGFLVNLKHKNKLVFECDRAKSTKSVYVIDRDNRVIDEIGTHIITTSKQYICEVLRDDEMLFKYLRYMDSILPYKEEKELIKTILIGKRLRPELLNTKHLRTFSALVDINKYIDNSKNIYVKEEDSLSKEQLLQLRIKIFEDNLIIDSEEMLVKIVCKIDGTVLEIKPQDLLCKLKEVIIYKNARYGSFRSPTYITPLHKSQYNNVEFLVDKVIGGSDGLKYTHSIEMTSSLLSRMVLYASMNYLRTIDLLK